jgi:DNA-binding NtrC family response regulator
MPPLRERREDIAALVDHYVAALNRRYQRSVIGFPGDVVNQMTQYDWPGNVREVRNVVEGAYAELPRGDVKFLAAPSALLDRLRETQSAPAGERDRLLAALRDARWNKSRAAEQLRWSRMTLYRKIAKYGLNGLSRL